MTSRKRNAFLLALTVFFVHALYEGGWGANQAARLGAIFTFVEPGPDQGTLRIDAYSEPRSARGFITPDWALVDGHYYPNKAPGTVFLGIPVYAALFAFETLMGSVPPEPFWTRVNVHVLNLLVGTLPTAISVALFFLLLLRLGSPPADAMLTALLYAFGTLVFPFDTAYWGHATTAAFLLAALFFFERKRGAFACGLCAGFALLTEYQAALSLALFTAAVAWRRPRSLPAFLAGAAGPVLVLLAYQAWVFGGPFRTAFGFGNPKLLGAGGGARSAFPGFSIEALTGLLVSEYRGLFAFCPVLLGCAIGIAHRWRHRAISLLCAAHVLGYVALIASFNGWHGGWSSGPRYLIPALPFLCFFLPDFSRLGLLRWPFAYLAVISTAEMWMVGMVGTFAPEATREPLSAFFLPLLFGWSPGVVSRFLFFRESFAMHRVGALLLIVMPVAWLLSRARRSEEEILS